MQIVVRRRDDARNGIDLLGGQSELCQSIADVLLARHACDRVGDALCGGSDLGVQLSVAVGDLMRAVVQLCYFRGHLRDRGVQRGEAGGEL